MFRRLFASGRYQPEARYGHASVVVQDQVIMWAGTQRDLPAVHSSNEKTAITSFVEVFNLRKGKWHHVPTGGPPPLGVHGYACDSLRNDIYYFGGHCGHEKCRHDTIHSLSAVTYHWREIAVTNPADGPIPKSGCGMVAFSFEGEDYLFIFGGNGLLKGSYNAHDGPITNKGSASYFRLLTGKQDLGCTNECHIFSLSQGKWLKNLQVTGSPAPSAVFSLSKISSNRAVLFGGWRADVNECLNSTFLVELSPTTIKWTRCRLPVFDDVSLLWPEGRCYHSSVCITSLHENAPPFILVMGGGDNSGNTLGNTWLFDILNISWMKIDLPSDISFRLYHSMSAFALSHNCVWVVIFGGLSKVTWNQPQGLDQNMIANSFIIELVKQPNGYWEYSGVVEEENYQGQLMNALIQGRNDWLSQPTSALGQQQSAYDNHKVPQKPSPTLQCHDQGQDSPQSSNKLSSSPQGLSRPPSQFQFAEMVIAKISSKWRRFGFLLEITSNELDTIQAGHAGVSPSDCFIDVFSLWQQTERRPFQWHTVVNILNTNSISEQRLAQVITDKFV